MFNKEKYDHKLIESIQDPLTGETICRAAIDPQALDAIKKEINSHAGTMQQFVSQSQSYFILLKSQMELLDKIKTIDDKVKVRLEEAVKKSKLDPKLPWQYSMTMGVFEYRKPPVMPGLSEAEIKSGQMPGTPANIQKAPGVPVN